MVIITIHCAVLTHRRNLEISQETMASKIISSLQMAFSKAQLSIYHVKPRNANYMQINHKVCSALFSLQ